MKSIWHYNWLRTCKEPIHALRDSWNGKDLHATGSWDNRSELTFPRTMNLLECSVHSKLGMSTTAVGKQTRFLSISTIWHALPMKQHIRMSKSQDSNTEYRKLSSNLPEGEKCDSTPRTTSHASSPPSGTSNTGSWCGSTSFEPGRSSVSWSSAELVPAWKNSGLDWGVNCQVKNNYGVLDLWWSRNFRHNRLQCNRPVVEHVLYGHLTCGA